MSYEEWHGTLPAPFKVGSIRVAPPWTVFQRPMSEANGPIEILLDPGVVFGTGAHPTTFDCLDALQKLYRHVKPESVLDIGTGTGLLALAAAGLGSRRILALDLNLLAVKTTRNNIRLNGWDDRILAFQGNAENFMDCPVDLLIANIHYDVMKSLLECKGFLQKQWFILSGLLRSEAKAVEKKLSRYPVRIIEAWCHNGIWHTFLGERSPDGDG
jgi:ribosomal protein L11 methyltransferase